MSVTSFLKPRLDQIVIVDPTTNVWATWAWVKRNWYKDTFKDAVRSAFTTGFARNEYSNLPFWFRKNAATDLMVIWRVSGRRTLVPMNALFVSASWESTAEVISKGAYPLRGITSGTYSFTVDLGGGNITIDLSSVIANGLGDLIDIVHALNINGSFNAVANAFVAGIGDAAQLGIRSIGTGAPPGGASVTVVTGLTNDCSELLGFSLAKENLYDAGDAPEVVGTFNQGVDYKAS